MTTAADSTGITGLAASTSTDVSSLASLGGSAVSTPAKTSLLTGQEFLALLTAQLQNQDPLSPMQSFEFTQQLASLASLEQLENISSAIGSLSGSNGDTSLMDAARLVGLQVELPGDAVEVKDGKAGQVTVELEKPAQKLQVQLIASDGKVARTIDVGAANAGPITVPLDRESDLLLPDGNYQVKIEATDSTGSPVNAQCWTSGTVAAVFLKDGDVWLVVNDREVPVSGIRRITMPPTESIATQPEDSTEGAEKKSV